MQKSQSLSTGLFASGHGLINISYGENVTDLTAETANCLLQISPKYSFSKPTGSRHYLNLDYSPIMFTHLGIRQVKVSYCPS